MVKRETLKKEIDKVQDQYLGVLFKIIKTFEIPDKSDDFLEIETDRQDWFEFIDKFAGCLEDDPIERGPQGEFEVRERIDFK